MSFWASNFWAANFWADNFWEGEGGGRVRGDAADPYKRVERKMKRRARGLDTIYMGEHNRNRRRK